MTKVVTLSRHPAPSSYFGIPAAIAERLIAAVQRLRIAYFVAFPPERCVVGAYLLSLPRVDFPMPPDTPGPDMPTPNAAALREGARLYEVAGEPRSDRELP